MAHDKPRELSQETMLDQIAQVLTRGRVTDPPAYTLILGAGASFGSIPTAKQMLGLPNQGAIHPQCIPAWLYSRENELRELVPERLSKCVRDFWTRFRSENPILFSDSATGNKSACIRLIDGVPDAASIPLAYTSIFDQRLAGGINTAAEARTYLRDITLPAGDPVQLNGTHFFLASMLSLQKRALQNMDDGSKPPYIGKRPFARTIFTTNFDPLLQISLQLFQLLYYMTDRPDLLSADALHTDDHHAIHLFYAHGSVHRRFLANTHDEIELLSRNARELAPYFATHGVIVLGYSGWDDCLLRALNQTSSFSHNLYWLARGDSSLTPSVRSFLRDHPSSCWVPIKDGGEFMAALHRRLCTGMRNTELLSNPIRPLRLQLERVKLSNVNTERSSSHNGDLDRHGSTEAAMPTTAEDFRLQIVQLLKDAEDRLTSDVEIFEPEERLHRAEHQADLAHSSKEYSLAVSLYTKIINDSAVTVDLKAKAFLRRGAAHAALSQHDQAIADFSRAIETPHSRNNQLPIALLCRAISWRDLGQYERAIADCSTVIELPKSLGWQVVVAFQERGNCYGKQGMHKQQIADCTSVIDSSIATTEQVLHSLIIRGYTFSKQGCSKQAVADYNRVIEMPDASAEQKSKALLARGLYFKEHKRPKQAIIDFTRIIDLPGTPVLVISKALTERAVCHLRNGVLKDSIADITSLINLSNVPADQLAAALMVRALHHERNKKPKLASADYTKIISLPGTPPVQLGTALVRRGSLVTGGDWREQSLADFNRAIDLPDTPNEDLVMALVRRGGYYAEAKQPELAIADFSRAIELPNAPSYQKALAMFLRGACYSQLNNPEAAEGSWKQVMEMNNAPANIVKIVKKILEN